MSFEIGFSVLKKQGDLYVNDKDGDIVPEDTTFSCGRTKLNEAWGKLVGNNPLVFNKTFDGGYLHNFNGVFANRVSDDDRRMHYRDFDTFKKKRLKACDKAEAGFLKYVNDLITDENLVEKQLNRLYEHAADANSDEDFQKAADRLSRRIHSLHMKLAKLNPVLYAKDERDEDDNAAFYDDDDLSFLVEDYLNAARVRTRLKGRETAMSKKDVVVYAYCSY